MKSEYLRQLIIPTLYPIKKLSLMSLIQLYGINIGITLNSLVMEFADSGDLYQEIVNYQKLNKYMDEDFIWRVFI